MNTQSGANRWMVGMLVALAVIIVGVGAYNLGVSHAVAVNPQVAGGAAAGAVQGAPGVVHHYGWHRPWGFGFLFPLFFFGFWFLMARTFFWRGGWRRYGTDYGPSHVPPAFDEWHKKAHDQMKSGGTPSPS
jgi:hypothetical protein